MDVCAADLAEAEAIYPMSEFMELFGQAKKLGMPFTIHAGECGNVQNILDSVEAGALRIGHGIAMRGNSEVQKMIREKGNRCRDVPDQQSSDESCRKRKPVSASGVPGQRDQGDD